MVRCDNCGYQNPDGALVCRRCKKRLRVRAEAVGPRRGTEAELTVVVAGGVSRLALVIGGILLLGGLLALPLYRRVEPGLLAIAGGALALGLLGWRQTVGLRRDTPR